MSKIKESTYLDNILKFYSNKQISILLEKIIEWLFHSSKKRRNIEVKPLYLYKTLHIVYYNLSVQSLIELGLEYSQIARILSETIKQGLIEDKEDEGLTLTDKGREKLKKLSKRINPTNKLGWLMPLDKYRIDKINKFDIYLPKKRV